VAVGLGRARQLQDPAHDPKLPKYYVRRDVSVSPAAASIWALCGGTTRWATSVARYKTRARLQRAAPDGLGTRFGLPRPRNAARDQKIHPARWTYDNIATMRRPSLKRMGLSLDWVAAEASRPAIPGYYYKYQQAAPVPRLSSRPGARPLSRRELFVNLGSGGPHGARQRAG